MTQEKRARSALAVAWRDPSLALAVVISASLFFAMLLLPLVGVMFGLFTPLPLIYTYCRRGRTVGLAVIGAAALVVELIFLPSSFPVAGLLFLEYGLMAAVMSESLTAGLGPEKVVGYPVAAVLVSGLVVLTVLSLAQGQSPWTYGRDQVRKHVTASMDMYKAMVAGKPPADEQAQSGPPKAPARPKQEMPALPAETLAWWSSLLTRLFPGLSVLGALLMAWLNFMGLKALMARRGVQPRIGADLKTWRPPDRLIWVVIAAGFAVVPSVRLLRDLGLNVLVVLGLVYFLAGLSVVAYWFDRRAVPRFFRVLIYALIVLQQYLALLVIGVGLFDLWFDFRRLKKASAPG